VFGHGLVYICTGWSPPKLLAIRPNGTGDVTESHVEWKTQRGVSNTPSTILVGDELYFISDRGVITCVDAKTGESHWTKRVGGGFSASPVYADGKIYFQSEQGEAIVIKPGLKYEELARNQFPGERTLASYAIADSALFIRTGTNLYRIQEQ
jgi:outer membrane protein assembly factor BamB